MDADRLRLLVLKNFPPRHEPRRRRNVNVRRTEIGVRLVGIEVVARNDASSIAVAHLLRLGPMNKILRGRAGNRPNFLRDFAEIKDITFLLRRPEGDILRIERPPFDVEHRLFLNLLPVNAVGRNKTDQSLRARAADPLVPLRRRNFGARIEKRAEVVRRRGRLRQNDVVLARTVHFVETKLRLCPMNAILRLGHAGAFVLAPVGAVGRHAAIINAIQIAILDDRAIPAEEPFPRVVELEHRPFIMRTGKHQLCVVELVDQVMINEQLALRTEFDRPIGQHHGRRDQTQ